MRKSLQIAVAALVLASCADTGSSWRKAGTSLEDAKSELGSCQALAYNTVTRPNPAVPPVSLDRRFGGNVEGPSRPTETRIREQQVVDSCMREKGYAFEPAAR